MSDTDALKPYLERFLKSHGVEFNSSGKFHCLFHEGDDTPSMGLVPESGGTSAYCFGCGKGADIFTFGAHFYGLDIKSDFYKIKKRIAAEFGQIVPEKPKSEKPPELPVTLSVDAAREVYTPQAIAELGKFVFGKALAAGADLKIEKVWPCLNEAGNVEFVEARFAPSCFANGKKRPCVVWWNGERLKVKSNPHGLFGRELLAQYPEKPVLIVEGPKCQEAAKALTDFVPVAWNGGAQGQKKVNFSPLRGRRVYIWPDDDEIGEKSARATAELLRGIADEIIIVCPLPEARKIKPEKADIVEALQVKTPEEITRYIKGHTQLPVGTLIGAEKERFEELAGKYEYEAGMTKADAELKAAADILDERKKKEAPKKCPRFVKIGGAPITPIRWIVKNFLEAGALGMIFGDSGTYKSFLAVALSACIATGKDFYGLPVRHKGAVYYVAAEGQMGIIRRFRAWSQENMPILDAPLYRYEGMVNLSAAADGLIKALEEAIQAETEPPALAVIDTWSRALGDDDSDTAAAAEGLAKLDAIRAQFPDMAVLVIHHTGHSNKDRARGASLLHAAVDSEYRLEVDKDRNIILTNTKSKESEPLPPMAFKARGVKLLADGGGYILNEDREVEASAVLEIVANYRPPVDGIGLKQKWVLDTLGRQENERLEYDDVKEAFKNEEGKDYRKDHLDRALDALAARDLIYQKDGFVCLGSYKNAEL
jgi:hypothetical protein